MKKTMAQLPEIKLVGITCRTNSTAEMEPSSAKIDATVQTYFHSTLQITHRKKPGITYCVYTNYESDFTGDYTFFIGEEVTQLEDIPPGYETLTIPPQNYAKFTNGPGTMPAVCIEAWQQIWHMTSADLGGERNYIADFEIYDERSLDPKAVTLDIYVGIK